MTAGDVRMKKSNTAWRGTFGGEEETATWLCLLTVFITLWF